MHASMHETRRHPAAGLLAGVAILGACCAALAAGPEPELRAEMDGRLSAGLVERPDPSANVCDPNRPFDQPPTEFARYLPGNVRAAIGGVGTKEGRRDLQIDVPGTPIAGWVYWSGELRRDFRPDDCITLTGGALASPREICGVEIGRRLQTFGDETQGGEVISRADLPLDALAPGLNEFTVSDFNEREYPNPDADPANPQSEFLPIYFRQYGITMLVVYEPYPPAAAAEVIVYDGIDVANYDRYRRSTRDCEAQTHTEILCFEFDALADCDHPARLRFGVSGLQPTPRGAPERTWFLSGRGVLPESVIGTGDVLEESELITSCLDDPDPACTGFYAGEDVAVFDGEVTLAAGDTWACMQIETFPSAPDQLFGQNIVLHLASLEIETECEPAGGGCLTRTPGFWGNHPHVTSQYLPLTSAGITLDNTEPETPGSANEDMCISGIDAKRAGTSMQQLQLLRHCAAAALNIAATSAGGGDCRGDDPSFAARFDECCGSLADSGAPASEISASGCIEEIDAFNNREDTMDPFGPFLDPGPADPSGCQGSRGNGYVNPGRDLGPR